MHALPTTLLCNHNVNYRTPLPLLLLPDTLYIRVPFRPAEAGLSPPSSLLIGKRNAPSNEGEKKRYSVTIVETSSLLQVQSEETAGRLSSITVRITLQTQM